MNIEFKIGDKVKRIKGELKYPHYKEPLKVGEICTVSNVEEYGQYMTVKNAEGISYAGCLPDNFELVQKDSANLKIVITTDGASKVTAAMYGEDDALVETTTFINYSSYDFMHDARVAFDKLQELVAEKKSYYTGKVVCIDEGISPDPVLKLGKVFYFKDGVCKLNSAQDMTSKPIESVEDLNDRFSSSCVKFTELIED